MPGPMDDVVGAYPDGSSLEMFNAEVARFLYIYKLQSTWEINI